MHLPPLVEPGPPLPPGEALRTARHTLLPELGEIGQRRLAAARVLVMGAGGLGAPVLQYLAAAGVGTIAVVDDDVVEISNLHRQVIHAVGSLGEAKTASAAQRLREIAPDVRVTEIAERLTDANALDVLAGWDVVVDGTDTFATRYLVADTCAALGIPLVWGSVLRFDAQVSVFWSRPPDGVAPVTLRTLFPQPPAPGSVPSCAEAGVLGALCGIAGSIMAVETVKLLAGFGDVLLGRVAVIDALTMRVHDVPFALGRATPSGTVTKTLSEEDRNPLGGGQESSRERTETLSRTLVDVREPGEFAQDALPGAINVPVSALEQSARSGPEAAAAVLRAAGVPDDVPLAAYCAAGIRSARAARTLVALGHDVVALTPDDVAHLRTRLTAASAPVGAP